MWNVKDIDQATDEVWRNNLTRTRKETIKKLLLGEIPGVDPLKGYKEDGSFKHHQIVKGPFAEAVVVDGNDHLEQAPDNNNIRDIYVIEDGVVLPKGYQVKIGDPNEHIFYSLQKRIGKGYQDDIILDSSLIEDGKLSDRFTPYKKDKLQRLIEEKGISLRGVPGLESRADSRMNIALGKNPLWNKIKLSLQNIYYGKA